MRRITPEILGVFIAAAVFFTVLFVVGLFDRHPLLHLGDIVEARVILDGSDSEDLFRTEYVLTNEDMLRDLVLQPIMNAKINSNPANYMFAGRMVLVRPGQKDWHLTIFLPWGEFRDASGYYSADFSRLQALLHQTAKFNESQTKLILEFKP